MAAWLIPLSRVIAQGLQRGASPLAPLRPFVGVRDEGVEKVKGRDESDASEAEAESEEQTEETEEEAAFEAGEGRDDDSEGEADDESHVQVAEGEFAEGARLDEAWRRTRRAGAASAEPLKAGEKEAVLAEEVAATLAGGRAEEARMVGAELALWKMAGFGVVHG